LRIVGGLVVGCALLLAGCAKYHAAPIDASKVTADFDARTLNDPDLQRFVDAHLKPSTTPPAKWDLQRLTLAAFYFHPDLDVARAKLAGEQAAIKSAGAVPNPTVGFTPEYDINVEQGSSPWTLGFMLDIPIETAGKRGYRIEQAQANAQSARLELAETAWQVRSRLRAALLDYLLSTRALELWQKESAARAQTVTLLERRLSLGEVSVVEVDIARADANNAKLSAIAAEGGAAEAKANLAAAIGIPVAALEGVGIEWAGLEKPSESASEQRLVERAAILNRLDVRHALSDYAAADAALKLEIAKQYPDLHLQPGYTFDQGENKFALGVSLELPVFNRNEGPIAEAEAHRNEIAARFLALQAQVLGQADSSLAKYRSALTELKTAEDLAKIENHRLASVQRAFEIGQEDRLTLASAQAENAATQRARLESLRKAQAALGALEDALQRPLDGGIEFPTISDASPRGEDHHE